MRGSCDTQSDTGRIEGEKALRLILVTRVIGGVAPFTLRVRGGVRFGVRVGVLGGLLLELGLLLLLFRLLREILGLSLLVRLLFAFAPRHAQ